MQQKVSHCIVELVKPKVRVIVLQIFYSFIPVGAKGLTVRLDDVYGPQELVKTSTKKTDHCVTSIAGPSVSRAQGAVIEFGSVSSPRPRSKRFKPAVIKIEDGSSIQPQVPFKKPLNEQPCLFCKNMFADIHNHYPVCDIFLAKKRPLSDYENDIIIHI